MNSYLLRRLAPFFVFSILTELGFMAFQMVQNAANVDFSFMALIKTSGVLLLTSSVSFLFVMLPYVLYLLILPRRRQNSPLDKILTAAAFFFFVFLTLCEEAASQIFWEEFSTSFNFIAVNYIIFTNKIVDSLEHSFPIIQILLAIILSAVIITVLAYHWLLTSIPAPKLSKRLFQTIIYGFVCVLAYMNVNMAQIKISPDSYNDEIAKEGTFSLLSSLHKNDIDYGKFYITGAPEQNLKLLQKQLSGKNVTFLEPAKNINRQINSFRPEKRANIIVVLLKDMNAKFMRPEFAPLVQNLQNLSRSSLFFPNAYAAGDRSVRAFEALTLSLPPLPGLSVLNSADNTGLYNLGTVFKTKGYDNKWIYGGYGMVDHMDKFFSGNGFQALDRSRWQNGDISFASLLAASDDDLYDKILREADKSFAAEKPFLTIALTASNRYPYFVPETAQESSEAPTPRLKAVKYADGALGRFLDNAKQKPWFDNTVFVFMADRASKKASKTNAVLDDFRIPLFIYAPKLVQPQIVRTPLSQLDVMPTVLGLLDFNYESRFFGQNVLDAGYEPRIFFGGWQKIAYNRDGITIALTPGHAFSVVPESAPAQKAEQLYSEAVAYYQQASQWQRNLKE